jgi:hypothetical protein
MVWLVENAPTLGVLPVSVHEFLGGWWQGPMAMR